MKTHVLLIDCPDQKGLIYTITGVLYRHDCNIVANSEFVDRETGHFFMRTEFTGDWEPTDMVDELRRILPDMAMVRLARSHRRTLVLLATKEAHCLGDLLLRHANDELNAQICAVISNYDCLEPLVRKFDIPFYHITHLDRTRVDHEAAILQVVERYDPEYLVLAKYMRILTPTFIAPYPQRIINIHHSFLPAFIGSGPYRQAFERGVKLIGATAHFVTDNLDTGPIIAQSVIPIDHTYSARDMAQAGRDVEKIVLARAIKLALEERIFLSGTRTIIFE